MPKSPAGAGVECKDVPKSIAGEGHSGSSGEDTGAGTDFAIAYLVGPANFACLVVDRFDHAFIPESVVSTGPTIGAICWLRKVKAITRLGVDNEQATLWIEARGSVIGKPTFVGSNQTSIRRRLFVRIRDRLPFCIQSLRPVRGSESGGEQALAIRAIEDKEIAIAGSLHQHLSRLAVKHSID